MKKYIKIIPKVIPKVIPKFSFVNLLSGEGPEYENLLKYSEDCTNVVWSKFGSPVITWYTDGSQRFVQTVASTSYLRQWITATVNDCLVDGGFYVFRAKLNTTGIADDYIRARLNNVGDGLGGLKTVQTLSYPEGIVDWSPVTIPFIANTTGVGALSSSVQITGIPQMSTGLTKDMQIVSDPGYTLYSAGDSICAYAINAGHVDGQAQYTGYYQHLKNITAVLAGAAGEVLSEIYARMQTDLATTAYPMIFIQGGINDINTAVSDPVPGMIATMTNMIILAKSRSDKVVVFNIPPNIGTAEEETWQLAYGLQLETLCATQGVQLFDMLAILGTGTGVEQNPDYYDTGNVHPNSLGHQVIAAALGSQVSLPSTAKYIRPYITNEGGCMIASHELLYDSALEQLFSFNSWALRVKTPE